MKLTDLDIKILKYLAENGVNASERVIAKKLRISPATYTYRLRKMEEERVISGYRYRLDATKIGLDQLSWIFFRLSHPAVDVEDILHKLVSYVEVHRVLFITGDYDIAMKVYCNDMDAVTKLVLKIESELKDYLISSATYFVTKRYKSHHTPLGETPKKQKISRTDLQLLRYRVEKPTATIRQISSELRLHRNTVRARWAKLFEEGIVLKKSAIISPDYFYKVGIAFNSIVFFDATAGKKEELAKKLAKDPNVHELNLITFPHDILAIIRTADIQSYYLLQKKFYSGSELAPLIARVKSNVIMHGVSRRPEYFHNNTA